MGTVSNVETRRNGLISYLFCIVSPGSLIE